jgi:hypothetical protein
MVAAPRHGVCPAGGRARHGDGVDVRGRRDGEACDAWARRAVVILSDRALSSPKQSHHTFGLEIAAPRDSLCKIHCRPSGIRGTKQSGGGAQWPCRPRRAVPSRGMPSGPTPSSRRTRSAVSARGARPTVIIWSNL